MIIRARHLQHPKVRYCAKGARYWFELHGLDWRDFIRNGIESEKLLATGDFLAKQIVEAIEQDGE